MVALIDELFDKNFIKDVLEFENEPLFDFDKLIVVGHSFGGATALKTGWVDKRVKCVLT